MAFLKARAGVEPICWGANKLFVTVSVPFFDTTSLYFGGAAGLVLPL
jgi:hypothetical protein